MGALTLQTAPTIEPVSLAEAKMHLRLDTETFDDNLSVTQSLAFGSHAIADNYTTHTGAAVEVFGQQAVAVLSAGTCGAGGGTIDTKIQESDNGTTWTDAASGAFAQITTATANADHKLAYSGTKKYIRTASKVLVAACEFGTSIIANAATLADEDLLTALITASRQHVEDITRRALLTQTWDYSIDAWPPGDAIKLPFGSLQSVTSVKWKDTDGTETTLTEGTDYLVETNGPACGRIVLPYGETWPSDTLYPSNPITIRFVCGWGAAADVPATIRAAVLMVLTDLWENREAQSQAAAYNENPAVSRLLASARLWDELP